MPSVNRALPRSRSSLLCLMGAPTALLTRSFVESPGLDAALIRIFVVFWIGGASSTMHRLALARARLAAAERGRVFKSFYRLPPSGP